MRFYKLALNSRPPLDSALYLDINGISYMSRLFNSIPYVRNSVIVVLCGWTKHEMSSHLSATSIQSLENGYRERKWRKFETFYEMRQYCQYYSVTLINASILEESIQNRIFNFCHLWSIMQFYRGLLFVHYSTSGTPYVAGTPLL